MPNDPMQAIEFAQSKGQARKDGKTGVLFADVAGCDDALRKLGYVVEARHLPWHVNAASFFGRPVTRPSWYLHPAQGTSCPDAQCLPMWFRIVEDVLLFKE